mgnify:CR=1 FL=1
MRANSKLSNRVNPETKLGQTRNERPELNDPTKGLSGGKDCGKDRCGKTNSISARPRLAALHVAAGGLKTNGPGIETMLHQAQSDEAVSSQDKTASVCMTCEGRRGNKKEKLQISWLSRPKGCFSGRFAEEVG